MSENGRLFLAARVLASFQSSTPLPCGFGRRLWRVFRLCSFHAAASSGVRRPCLCLVLTDRSCSGFHPFWELLQRLHIVLSPLMIEELSRSRTRSQRVHFHRPNRWPIQGGLSDSPASFPKTVRLLPSDGNHESHTHRALHAVYAVTFPGAPAAAVAGRRPPALSL